MCNLISGFYLLLIINNYYKRCWICMIFYSFHWCCLYSLLQMALLLLKQITSFLHIGLLIDDDDDINKFMASSIWDLIVQHKVWLCDAKTLLTSFWFCSVCGQCRVGWFVKWDVFRLNLSLTVFCFSCFNMKHHQDYSRLPAQLKPNNMLLRCYSVETTKPCSRNALAKW